MKKLKHNRIYQGKYYIYKKVLQFEGRQDIISDRDIIDLFFGLVNLIKKTTEIKIEEKYISIVNSLKKEVEILKNQSNY